MFNSKDTRTYSISKHSPTPNFNDNSNLSNYHIQMKPKLVNINKINSNMKSTNCKIIINKNIIMKWKNNVKSMKNRPK